MRNMKKILLFPLSLAVLVIAGCNEKSAMDEDLYPEKVYIVGSRDRFIDRNVDIGNTEDVITVAVGVSGSRPSKQDVTAVVVESPYLVERYNVRERSPLQVQYQSLAVDAHSYLSDRVTIKAGMLNNTYPINIKTTDLHMDSLYMIALQLESTSAYELNSTDTVAYVRLNLVNRYSGQYYMDGRLTDITSTLDPKPFITYVTPRTLKATDNGNTVRMFHFNSESNYDPTVPYNSTNDFLTNSTFKITVNPDKTLTLTPWDKFVIYEGESGGVYHEDMQIYEIWYYFKHTDNKKWLCEGYLYKQPEGSNQGEKLRVIENWIEVQRLQKAQEGR